MISKEALANAGISPEAYYRLSEDERQAVDQVLREVANGHQEVLDELYYADYDEIPVDFVTFITDDNYLGKSTRNGQFLYPFWKKEDTKIFNLVDTEGISEVALSGCLSGDTLIPLIDGTSVTIKELAESGKKNFGVYSYDLDTNMFTVGTAVKAFFTGYKMTYKVTFDNGESIRITGNHKFLTRDKHYKSIDQGLSVGDSIMPFNTHLDNRGYEIISHPQKDGTYIEEPTHRMVMRYKIGPFRGVVHHKNANKRDNSPRNLIRMEWRHHRHYHAVRGAERFRKFNQDWRDGNVSADAERRYREGHRKGSLSRWSDPHQHEEASKRASLNNQGNTYGSMISCEQREIKRQRTVEYNKTQHPRGLSLAEITKEEVINAASKSFTRDQLAKYLKISRCGLSTLLERYNITPEVFFRKSPFNLPNRYWTSRLTIYNELYHKFGYLDDEVVKSDPRKLPRINKIIKEYFNGDPEPFYDIVKNFNHKIVSIYLNDIEPVYDIEVEKYHNFALSAGIVVHNSIGTGKTTNGVLLMLYHLYRTMCMRDPQAFFGLSPGSQITYAFLNNTLASSYGVAYQTFQAFIQESPWFLKHGTITGRANPEYIPDKGFGFVVGSRPQHTLGKNIIASIMDEVSFAPGQNVSYEKCLVGETIIKTSEGEFRIEDLEGKSIIVLSWDEKEQIVESDECSVIKTKEATELFEIELEDGTVLKCTPEHRWLLKDGTYKMAKDLSAEDELLDIG